MYTWMLRKTARGACSLVFTTAVTRNSSVSPGILPSSYIGLLFFSSSLCSKRFAQIFLSLPSSFLKRDFAQCNPWLGELMDHKNRGYYAASAHLLSRGHVSCWSRACPTGVFSSTIQIQQPWGKKNLLFSKSPPCSFDRQTNILLFVALTNFFSSRCVRYSLRK